MTESTVDEICGYWPKHPVPGDEGIGMDVAVRDLLTLIKEIARLQSIPEPYQKCFRQLQDERERLSKQVEELEADLADIREQFHTQEQRNVEQRQVLVRTRNRDVKQLRDRIQAVVNALHRLPIVPNAGEWGEERYEAFWAAIHELEKDARDGA